MRSFLEYVAIRVNGPQAQELQVRFAWQVGDEACRRLTLSNGALNHLPGSHGSSADAVVRTARPQLARLLQGRAKMLRALDAGELDMRGDRDLFRRFLETLDEFEPMFNVVEP